MFKKSLFLLGLLLSSVQSVHGFEEDPSIYPFNPKEETSHLEELVEASAFAPAIGRQENIPYCYHITGTYLFEGDNKQQFKGDYVAVLEDGSAWKIHPEDAMAYSTWSRDDIIQPQVRTSFYWFKREHKFFLYNHTRNVNLRAMLISYPTSSLYITGVQKIATGGHWEHKKYEDAHGNVTIVNEWVVDYIKNVYLNDGTIWAAPKHIELEAGKFVLMGLQNEGDRFWYFMALGLQRDSFYIKPQRLQ